MLATPQPRVVTADGRRLETDVVVLALGNPPPRPRPDLEHLGDRFVADPWTDALAARARDASSVLLIGTGLTMVDVVAQLHDDHPGLVFTAVSRSLLVPRSHRRRTRHPHDAFDPGVSSLDDLVDAVLRRIAEVEEIGGDWRDVIDAVRAYGNTLWQGFDADDQGRFVAEVARRWDVSRHRMSPEMASYIDGLLASGVLELAPAGTVDPTTYDLVVNCSGPAPVQTPRWNPLVDRLLARGVLTPHRLGLGLDLDRHGRPRGADGEPHPDVYVLGAARKGLEWEVTAIPDLRAQAVALTDHLAARHHTPSTSPPRRTTKAETTTRKKTRTKREPRATADPRPDVAAGDVGESHRQRELPQHRALRDEDDERREVGRPVGEPGLGRGLEEVVAEQPDEREDEERPGARDRSRRRRTRWPARSPARPRRAVPAAEPQLRQAPRHSA